MFIRLKSVILCLVVASAALSATIIILLSRQELKTRRWFGPQYPQPISPIRIGLSITEICTRD